MQVFYSVREDQWHLIGAKRWGSADYGKQLVDLYVQFFCQDRAFPYGKKVKLKIEEYNKAKHRKHLCLPCQQKALASKRHGPIIEAN